MTTATETKIARCPNCGHLFRVKISPAIKTSDGHVSGCPECAYIIVLLGSGMVRPACRSEWPILDNHPNIDIARQHVRDVVEKRYWG